MSQEMWLPDARGLDPFDALRGSRVPAFVHSSPRLRQIVIQLRKRMPIDIGPLLGVKPFAMAKTLGCLLWAEARHSALTDAPSQNRAERLVAALDATGSGSEDGGWGYEFDVQTRWAYYSAGSPNLIATAFVGRGLLSAGTVFGRPDWLERGAKAAQFASERLLRESSDGVRSFRYTLDTERLIHNANLLGCALCADAVVAGADDDLRRIALEAAAVSLDAQTADGAWPYGAGDALAWVDSFHTAYDLDGLLQVWLLTHDTAIAQALTEGAQYWAANFFGSEGQPGYYADKVLPYDIHSAATAVDVGARLAVWGFADRELVERVADWTRRHLVDSRTGRTYYRVNRGFTDRRSFARWGDAHWALARASLAVLVAGEVDALENRVSEVSGWSHAE